MPAAPPVPPNGSFVRRGVNFNLLPAVQRAQVAALGVTTHVTALHPFAVKHATEVALEVFAVGTDPLAGRVVRVVVEDRGDTGLKLRIIRDLHNDVVGYLGVTVVVP